MNLKIIFQYGAIVLIFYSIQLPSSLLGDEDISKTFIAIAKKSIPAVVFIEAEIEKSEIKSLNSGLKFRRGSGFFISSDGKIVTAAHVIANTIAINVITYNKSVLPAKILDINTTMDIAVLQIDGFDFPFLTFENSEDLENGELTMAIGYSIPHYPSLFLARVDGKDIQNIRLLQLEDYIQTTTAINLGSSGGPLLNAKGQVVGVNTATLISKQGEYIGKSLAISSRLAMHVLKHMNLSAM